MWGYPQVADSEKKLAAVYVAFATFKSAIEQLGQGVHSKIDRSVFPGFAWAIQNQLFAGMRFLGLIDSNSEPTPVLADLVEGTETERKHKLRSVLEKRYSELFAMDLTKTTPDQLAAKMTASYGMTGDTRDKGLRFFLAAVDYVGVPISPLFKKGKTGAPTVARSKKRISKPRIDGEVNGGGGGSDAGTPTPGTSKSVKLRSGGTLTVSATLDLFALSSSDRNFVFEIIDRLEYYEQAPAEA